MEVYHDNMIADGERYIGRIDRETHAIRHADPSFVFCPATRPPGAYVLVWGHPVEISGPLFVGGPADWKLNPDAVAQIRGAHADFVANLVEPS